MIKFTPAMSDPKAKHQDPPHPDPISDENKQDNNDNNIESESINKSSLKLDLSNVKKVNHPSSEPNRLNMKSPRRKKQDTNPLNTARARKQESQLDKPDHYEHKRIIPLTPRLDELPLSLRLHSNPMILLQSLRRQKVSNYNMYHTEPAIDNKPDKNLKTYAQRRKKWRECDTAFPSMPPLSNDIPKFVAKQFKYEFMMNYTKCMKEHKLRCNNMRAHIDNKLPKHIQSYRKMRRDRLKNAEKKARKLHEKRLRSPPNPEKAPKAPTRALPPSTKQRLSQIQRERAKKAEEKAKNEKNIKLQIESSNAAEILYVNDSKAIKCKYTPSPKKLLTPSGQRRKTIIQALPCHFDEWKK